MAGDTDRAIRKVVKGASVVYAGLLIQYIVSFFGQVIAANFLSVGSFGNVITGTAVIDIGAIAATIGLNIGLARNLPRQREKAERLKLANAAYLIGIPVSIIVGAIISLNAQYIAATVFSDSSIAISIQIFGATVPFAVVYNLSTGGIRGQEISRYRVYLRNLLHPISRILLIAAAVIYGLGEIGFLAAYAVPYAIVAIASTFLFTRALPGFRVIGKTDFQTAKSLLGFSFPISISNAMGFLIRSSDIFIVLYFLNNEAVGAYGVVYALARLVGMFSTAFNFLGMPIASKLESDEKFSEALSMNEAILRWLGILSVPIVFPMVVFPTFIISFIYGPDYASGWSALMVLSAGFAIHNVFSPNRSILTALGRTKVMMVNNMLTATLNAVLNFAMIPEYGIMGAAVATIAAYLFRDAIVLLELKKFTGRVTVTRRVVTPILIAAPIISTAAYFTSQFETTIYTVTVSTIVLGAVYIGVIVLTIGFAPEEVMLIRSAEEKYGFSLGFVDDIVEQFSQ